jgi:hypothetical protein
MPEFMGFGEGGHYVRDFGLPRTCWFALSTKAVDDFSVIDTLAGGIGEVSGTGYARQSQPAPNWSPPWPGETVIAEFEPVVFTTHTARDWPDAVRSIVLGTRPFLSCRSRDRPHKLGEKQHERRRKPREEVSRARMFYDRDRA